VNPLLRTAVLCISRLPPSTLPRLKNAVPRDSWARATAAARTSSRTSALTVDSPTPKYKPAVLRVPT